MKKLALLLSLALSFSAIADDHAPTSSYLVESIPFTLKDGKTMADMMAMQDEFAAVAQASGLQYSAFVMTPHYMSQSSAPIAGSFDAVWLGFSPSATAIGAGFEGYMENGQELEAKFDEIRTMSQRSLMRGEMVHAGDPFSKVEMPILFLTAFIAIFIGGSGIGGIKFKTMTRRKPTLDWWLNG